MNDRLHWDEVILRGIRLTRPHRQRALRPLVGAVLTLAVVVGLLPGAAGAHYYENSGRNGARLYVEMYEGTVGPWDYDQLVRGQSFMPNQPVEIFQCPTADPADARQECERTGVAVSDGEGFFEAKVLVSAGLMTKDVYCAPIGTSQCAMYAATYNLLNDEPTSDAQHHLCFGTDFAWLFFPTQYSPRQPYEECDGPPPETASTTTTTIPLTSEWRADAPLNVARRDLATTVGLDGKIYALGGTSAPMGSPRNADDGQPALASAEVLDPCGRKGWSRIPDMPTARTQFAAATGRDGRIYAIGGRDTVDGTPLATVDAYDPGTGSWTEVGEVASLAVPRGDLAAATDSHGLIYAIGGVAGGGVAVQTVEAFDPAVNQWAEVTPSLAIHVRDGATTAQNGRIYAVGLGYRDIPFPPLQSPGVNESYLPGSEAMPGTWRPEPAPEFEPYNDAVGHAAVITGANGLIYAIGGEKASTGEPAKRTVWAFDTDAATWTLSPEAMTARRTRLGAAAGKDGRIYAIGGLDYEELDADLEPSPALATTESARVGASSCAPPPADFDGDDNTDFSVFRPEGGTWFVRDGLHFSYGADGDIPVPADYDGDNVTDRAIFRPSVGLWAIHNSEDGTDTFLTYGIGTDVPVPADYDGDGRADIAIFRPEFATWWVRYSSTGTDVPTTFGIASDVPVPADYDGDRRTDIAVFRDGTWFVQPATGGPFSAHSYGDAGDIPVPGDYDADNIVDRAVFRAGTWYLHHSTDGADEVVGFGIATDIPVPGDYNGDRIWDPAMFRDGTWFVETGEVVGWGTNTDIALPLPAAIRMAAP